MLGVKSKTEEADEAIVTENIKYTTKTRPAAEIKPYHGLCNHETI